jgi:hypothetical protein
MVFGNAGAEAINAQCIPALEKLEMFRRGLDVKDSLLCADRTIAFRQTVKIDPGAELHPAAMAAALTNFEHLLARQFPLILDRDPSRRKRT